MKIVCISDTHGLHSHLELPKGDMIIHAGDLTKNGSKNQVVDFLDWYSKLDFEYKNFIAGNHDFFFENQEEINKTIPDNIIYLNDSGIEINGIKIWGSPYTTLVLRLSIQQKKRNRHSKTLGFNFDQYGYSNNTWSCLWGFRPDQ